MRRGLPAEDTVYLPADVTVHVRDTSLLAPRVAYWPRIHHGQVDGVRPHTATLCVRVRGIADLSTQHTLSDVVMDVVSK